MLFLQSVMTWKSIVVYEDVPTEDCLDQPYKSVTDEVMINAN